jgi:hypothetical protein
MTNRIRPALDDFQYSHETEEMLAKRAEQRFLDETPEGKLYTEKYSCRDASQLLIGWCTANTGGCISVNNLQVAFRELVADGIMKPRPVASEPAPEGRVKYSPPVLRRLTAAEQALIDRPHSSDLTADEARKLSPIPSVKIGAHAVLGARKTAPVSPELELAYRKTISKVQADNKATEKQIRDARISVGLARPDLPVQSQEFSRLVSEEISRLQQ